MNKPKGFEELHSRLTRNFEALPDLPEETPESTLCALWSLAMGQPVSAQAAGDIQLRDLDDNEMQALLGFIARRESGEPLAHISGRQHFGALELLASPDALVPRRETEILARAAMDKIKLVGSVHPDRHPTVIDVCTGCGNLPLLYAYYFPDADVFAADLSEDAIALANRNGDFTGLTGKVLFAVGDLLAPFDKPELRGLVDVISCNPPYISSKKVGEMAPQIANHEPSMAFDGGPFGISILQRLMTEAPPLLRPGGWLLFEVGLGQGPSLVKKLQRTPAFDTVETHCDDVGEIRAIGVRKAQEGNAT